MMQHGDWTIPQNWDSYTVAEHRIWDRLFSSQVELLRGRAVPQFLNGIAALEMGRPGIPDFEHLSERLHKLTGWSVVAVPGLIPDEVFFDHLANRRFVAGNFIRSEAQFGYLKEPDIFHDIFGHVPLLADPVFADYMQAYGKGGQRAASLGTMVHLARLYWYTVEFGLIKTEEGLRIFGAGIVSSPKESLFSLESPLPNRITFDLARVMKTTYRIDDFQQSYFVIDSFENLLKTTLSTDFGPIYKMLEGADAFDPAAVVPEDVIIHLGSQCHAEKENVRASNSA